jgi:hypothetical protein
MRRDQRRHHAGTHGVFMALQKAGKRLRDEAIREAGRALWAKLMKTIRRR